MALGFMDQSTSNVWWASLVRKMRKELAKIKGIGSIMFRTIYGFYDESLLFSCESLTGALDAHYIEWIVLVTEGGMRMKWLKPGMTPMAEFVVNEKVVAAYEYCNLHGLWKAEV